jgi:hypothetical protein
MSSILHKELTKSILKIFYDVYNELGYGFLERVYQNALFYELKENGFKVEANEFQLINYLKSTDCEVGLLLNFGKKPEFIRKVYQNYKK